ncbi:hypothetical protein KHQ81_12905 [Mycoplasmatota bacterium]|nr:hypothetical protein KHQ81_12905 [Mycoplasmatota bacterium]
MWVDFNGKLVNLKNFDVCEFVKLQEGSTIILKKHTGGGTLELREVFQDEQSGMQRYIRIKSRII